MNVQTENIIIGLAFLAIVLTIILIRTILDKSWGRLRVLGGCVAQLLLGVVCVHFHESSTLPVLADIAWLGAFVFLLAAICALIIAIVASSDEIAWETD